MQTDTSNIPPSNSEKTAQPQARESGTRKAPAKQSVTKTKTSSKQNKVLSMLQSSSGNQFGL
jgi:hypothetical protein